MMFFSKFVKKANETLFFDMPRIQTKTALLLGCKSVSGSVARLAAEEYKKGTFENFIIAGGQPVREMSVYFTLRAFGIDPKVPEQDFTTTKSEADYMAEILMRDYGIPANAIIAFDNESEHTGTNIENTLDAIQGADPLTIFCLATMQNRAIGTIRKKTHALPNLTLATHPVFPFGFTRENWHRGPFIPFVYKELKKVLPKHESRNTYIGKHMDAVDINAEILNARYRGHTFDSAYDKLEIS